MNPDIEKKMAELKARQLSDEPVPMTEIEQLRCENLSLKREVLQAQLADLDEKMNTLVEAIRDRLGVNSETHTLRVNVRDWTIRVVEKEAPK